LLPVFHLECEIVTSLYWNVFNKASLHSKCTSSNNNNTTATTLETTTTTTANLTSSLITITTELQQHIQKQQQIVYNSATNNENHNNSNTYNNKPFRFFTLTFFWLICRVYFVFRLLLRFALIKKCKTFLAKLHKKRRKAK